MRLKLHSSVTELAQAVDALNFTSKALPLKVLELDPESLRGLLKGNTSWNAQWKKLLLRPQESKCMFGKGKLCSHAFLLS